MMGRKARHAASAEGGTRIIRMRERLRGMGGGGDQVGRVFPAAAAGGAAVRIASGLDGRARASVCPTLVKRVDSASPSDALSVLEKRMLVINRTTQRTSGSIASFSVCQWTVRWRGVARRGWWCFEGAAISKDRSNKRIKHPRGGHPLMSREWGAAKAARQGASEGCCGATQACRANLFVVIHFKKKASGVYRLAPRYDFSGQLLKFA
jgi:hypothetical protein